MIKKNKCILTIITLLLFALLFSFNALATETTEIPYKSYTYWVDYNTAEKTPVPCRPAYEIKQVIKANFIDSDIKMKFSDVCVGKNGNSYILDNNNSKVYIFDKNYNLQESIENLSYNGENISFSGAQGIFVDLQGKIYIADTENQRVLILNSESQIIDIYNLPESDLIPSNFKYRPIKVAVDSRGYTYILSEGSYYGALLYSPEKEFLGFFGANTVKSSAMDVLTKIWNRLFSNDLKRAADEISLPYTFTDIVIGQKDFIYTTTGRSGTSNIQNGQICKLNPGGKNILESSSVNFADSAIGALQGATQVQDLSCIAVDKNGYFYALDTTYGRIFWYDDDCNLISVFGGSIGDGIQDGTFSLASAIDLNNKDIIVLDSQKNTLTIFGLTDYGQLVYDSQIITLSGNYSLALDNWKKVISLDSNNQLAYRGLAKAYYDIGDNDATLKYAKLGVDREIYAKAFKYKRTEILENSFYWLFFGLLIIIAIFICLKYYLKKNNIVLINNIRIKTAFSTMTHPVESFRLVKEKQQGSILIASIILLGYYVATVLNDTHGGFAFTVFDSQNYNALFVFLSTVGLALLWTGANWLICTLAGGIGKIKEIFIVTCYSIIPMLLMKITCFCLTHILTPDEGAFLSVLMIAFTLYSAFIFIVGMMRIHDYEFGKFIFTAILTIICMLIIIFLIFLIIMLSQQVFGWFKTICIELLYR